MGYNSYTLTVNQQKEYKEDQNDPTIEPTSSKQKRRFNRDGIKQDNHVDIIMGTLEDGTGEGKTYEKKVSEEPSFYDGLDEEGKNPKSITGIDDSNAKKQKKTKSEVRKVDDDTMNARYSYMGHVVSFNLGTAALVGGGLGLAGGAIYNVNRVRQTPYTDSEQASIDDFNNRTQNYNGDIIATENSEDPETRAYARSGQRANAAILNRDSRAETINPLIPMGIGLAGGAGLGLAHKYLRR